ncbi:MAG TPA: DUF1592 domain-containing protein [Polyangiaceae bacterium]|nr:DUF1592 domain-containing protein [Polyangiaceae bacterium]
MSRSFRRGPTALSLLVGLFSGLLACTGEISGPEVSAPSAGAPSTGVPSNGSAPSAGGGAGAAAGVPTVPEVPVVGEVAAVLVPTSRVTRMSRLQWANSVQDLLRVSDIGPILEQVPGDAVVGLDNDASSLFVGQQQRADLEKAAQALAEKISGDAAALGRLMPVNAPTEVTARGKAFIESFGLRAFRRPLSAEEVAGFAALFAQGPTLYPGVDAFRAGVNLLLQAFLQSPHFLYRTELGSAPAGAAKVPLSDYEVAAKLAFALTNRMPDDTAFELARAGKLHDPQDVATEAVRLLTSQQGAAGRDHLHFQIYRLGAYDGILRDTTVFPEFTAATPDAMRKQVLLFSRHLFDQNLGVKELFTSNVGFVNSALAPLYGLSGTFGDELQKVELDPTQRAGLLTQAGVLASYAVVNDPDTIRRGVFVNQRILCITLPPPAPDAGQLAPLSENMTNRERVDATTGPGTCGAGCHSTVINPPGHAFESFDAVGKHRTMDRGKPVDTTSAYSFNEGLKSFNGPVEFSKLVAESSQAHGCYVQNWASYLNGREPAAEEQPYLAHLAQLSLQSKLSIKELVLRLVTNEAFLNRLP